MSLLPKSFGDRAAKAAGLIIWTSGMLMASATAMATDVLHNTTWKTIDDTTGKPKAVISIKEVNGKLIGRIIKLIDPAKQNKCMPCTGKYANKSLAGVAIFWSLEPKGNNLYANGVILDPKKDKTYKLKGELVNGGKTLEMRGYLGTPMLGRTQTWHRVN